MTALKAPCPHGRYEEHPLFDEKPRFKLCPGGTLLPPDSLVIVKEECEWPEWASSALRNSTHNQRWIEFSGDIALDALAAAQKRET